MDLSIEHPNDEDLDAVISAPSTGEVELFTDVGGAGDNFTQTNLDDEARTAIVDGAAPFTGAFRPEGALATLNGTGGNGRWTLFLRDDTRPNSGRLIHWAVQFCEPSGAATATPTSVATSTPTAASRPTRTPAVSGAPHRRLIR